MTRLLNSPHFDSEQAERLKGQFQLNRMDELAQVNLEGNQLITEFREMLRIGKEPDDPAVQGLAKRWKQEIERFAPVDDEFVRSAESYYSENPLEAAQYGMDGELYAYIKKAVALL
ncbi:TipAS antibiotic-recognition domain-containing protein [Paenibacillus sp. 1011MAR3C5]|uniref:TipAS antibiotic-recognition domain-containing protein n=1 Tax=Paenibacillus sp. 1011MAR3C5 TaxID=1675787 RepID=UPI001600442C|nr:TipAS antibiotic-recognition domain-containing protein [Paenibacillus sp. 1011MAR3C5]